MNKKIIITIFGFLLVAGGACYLFNLSKNTPAPIFFEEKNEATSVSSDWKTYRNEEYGFKISYPSGWTTYEEKVLEGEAPVTIFQGKKEGVGETHLEAQIYDLVSVRVLSALPRETPLQTLQRETHIDVSASKQNEIVVGGIPAIIIRDIPSIVPYNEILIKHGDTVYDIIQLTEDDIFAKILSTFGVFAPTTIKKIETTNIPSDWKTYKSADGTYKIGYPSDWFVKVNGGIVQFSNVAVYGELSDKTLQNEAFLQVSYRDNQSHWPIEKWFENSLNFVSQSHTSTSIDGKPAVRWIPAEGVGARVGYVIQVQDKIVDVIHQDQKKFTEIYEKMLSSIKFDQAIFRSFPPGISTSTPFGLRYGWEGENKGKFSMFEWKSGSTTRIFSQALTDELYGVGEFPAQVHAGVLNPNDQRELILSKTVFHTYHPNPCTFTRSFYALDIPKGTLTKFFEETEQDVPKETYQFCTDPVIFGRDGSKILFWYHTPETSGVCTFPLTLGERLYALDLSDLSQGVQKYIPPKELVDQEEEQFKYCQENGP